MDDVSLGENTLIVLCVKGLSSQCIFLAQFWFVFFFCFLLLFLCILAIEEKPGMHIVEIQSKATVDCCLIFSPTQVRFWPTLHYPED